MVYQAGDECLRAIAATLTAGVRRPGDVVARFGGEEFVVLLPETSLEGARLLAETIRSAVFDLDIPHPTVEPRRVTISIGCAALIPRASGSYHQLVELADEALYQAKRMGRNRVCIAESDADAWRPGTAGKLLRARIAALKRQRR